MIDKSFSELSKKTECTYFPLAAAAIGDRECGGREKRKQGVGEMVCYLADMGLDPKDVAEILGAPLSSVRTLLTPKRRK